MFEDDERIWDPEIKDDSKEGQAEETKAEEVKTEEVRAEEAETGEEAGQVNPEEAEEKEEPPIPAPLRQPYGEEKDPDESEEAVKPRKRGIGKRILAVAASVAVFTGVCYGGFMLADHFSTKQAKETGTQTASLVKNTEDGVVTVDKESGSSEEGSSNAVVKPAISTEAGDVKNAEPASVSVMDVSEVVEATMPTVVQVTNKTIYQSTGSSWSWFGDQGSSGETEVPSAGSGVIISENDTEVLIVTNAHVVVPETYSNYQINSFEISATFCDGKEVKAYIKGTDTDADLAVIAVAKADMDADTLEAIRIAVIGNSDSLKVGNGVIAIGNAMGFGQSVTVGYVSALNRSVTIDGVTRQLLQTDAAINPGNSGGGLFDTQGYLIGINSAKYSSTSVEGIGYAIPISSSEEIISDLMNRVPRTEVTDEDQKSYIGVLSSNKMDQMYAGQGAFVADVTEGGPAANAGIMAYDIIIGIDDTEISSWSDLEKALTYYKGGETVKVTYLTLETQNGRRSYEEKIVDITLAYRKDYVTSSH